MKSSTIAWLAISLLASSTASDNSNCTSWPEEFPIEHQEHMCQLAAQHDECINGFKVPPEGISALPEEKTEICPAAGNSWTSSAPLASGQRVKWVVFNSATEPVTLAWVRSDGLEVSALDGKSPPEAAVLLSGDWQVLDVIEGHVIHVRRLPAVGGALLMRHRAGTRVVRLPKGMACMSMTVPKTPERPPDVPCLKNECNAYDLSFVNRVGCPVDLYWAPTDGSCERFSARLGTSASAESSEFGSSVHRETSYISHRFAVRLSENNALVSHFTIERTVVHDCPEPGAKLRARSSLGAHTLRAGIGRNHTRVGPRRRQSRPGAARRTAAGVCSGGVTATKALRNAGGNASAGVINARLMG